ncbi:glycoside hydrolase family 43 protein [soil metagenome]
MSRPANPILRGMYPDPSVCRVDGTYYLVNSTFEYLPGLPIHASTDLENWRLVGHAIHDPAQFDFSAVGDSHGMFAPTIRHHDGLFYVACTFMGDGETNFYVTATDVAGPWSAPVVLPDARGIDPSLFFHEGRAWWVGCRQVDDPTFEGETEVWLRELDLTEGRLVGDERVIWTRTQYRAVWAEGPHLYERDGWFYLVTAEGGTSFEHSVMVARSKQVDGPYLPCPRNPVLTHRHLGHRADVQNVGHADLFEGDGDQWWLVALASRPLDGHHILGRETHVARVEWEDGWPVVNATLGTLEPPVVQTGRWGPHGVPTPDDFLSVRGFATFASVEPDGVLLHSTAAAPGATQPPAALLRRVTSIDSRIAITLDGIEVDAVAGLILRQSDDAHVRLELAHGPADDALSVRLVVRHGTDDMRASVELPVGRVTLNADLTPGGITFGAATASSDPVELGQVPLSALSTETAGGFVGTTFGPYVAGPQGSTALLTSWVQEDRS